MKPLDLLTIGIGAYGIHRYISGTDLTPQQLAQRWMVTLARRNPDEIIKLYSMDGLLIPTFGEIKRGRAAIKGYFERFMGYEGLEGQYDSMIVQEYVSNRVNGCIVSGLYTFEFLKDAYHDQQPTSVQARYSFVFDSKGEIMNHHSSAMPET